MKISVLMENTSSRPDIAFEHGLSLFIETPRHRLLFDTGASGAFAANAEKLGIDLSTVDLAVLSHGHDDHGGGLRTFLSLNHSAPVYVNRNVFGPYYNEALRYISLDPELKSNPQLIQVGDNITIDEELSLCTCNHEIRYFPVDSAGLSVKSGENYKADPFVHEQYLMIRTGGRKYAVSGCSHKGILNLMKWLQPDVMIGGFHFMKLKLSGGENDTLRDAAAELLRYPAEYYTCHCTGLAQYDYLKQRMGNRLHYLSAGQTVEL